jgi:hypothetical protein
LISLGAWIRYDTQTPYFRHVPEPLSMESPHWGPPLEISDDVEDSLGADIPDALICSISFGIMRQPALVTTSGQSYERDHIFEVARRSGVDPRSRTPFTASDVVPNVALKQAIERFVRDSAVTAAGEANRAAAAEATVVAAQQALQVLQDELTVQLVEAREEATASGARVTGMQGALREAEIALGRERAALADETAAHAAASEAMAIRNRALLVETTKTELGREEAEQRLEEAQAVAQRAQQESRVAHLAMVRSLRRAGGLHEIEEDVEDEEEEGGGEGAGWGAGGGAAPSSAGSHQQKGWTARVRLWAQNVLSRLAGGEPLECSQGCQKANGGSLEEETTVTNADTPQLGSAEHRSVADGAGAHFDGDMTNTETNTESGGDSELEGWTLVAPMAGAGEEESFGEEGDSAGDAADRLVGLRR